MAALSMNNLPHTISLWRKDEATATDGTKRIGRPGYTRMAQDIAAAMMPVSAAEKLDMGYAFDQNVYRAFVNVTHKDKATQGDILRWGAHAYSILEWLVYDIGAASVQHIEVMCERLPTVPQGVS